MITAYAYTAPANPGTIVAEIKYFDYFPDLDLTQPYRPERKLLPKELPSKIKFEDPDYESELLKKGLPEFFYNAQFFFVSPRLKSVLEEFNLGKTTFKEVRLYGADGETELPDVFYIMHIADTKPGVDLENSPGVSQSLYGGPYYSINYCDLPWSREKDEVLLDASAMDGPEIWVNSILVSGALFFSVPLAERLRLEGFCDDLPLNPCRSA